MEKDASQFLKWRLVTAIFLSLATPSQLYATAEANCPNTLYWTSQNPFPAPFRIDISTPGHTTTLGQKKMKNTGIGRQTNPAKVRVEAANTGLHDGTLTLTDPTTNVIIQQLCMTLTPTQWHRHALWPSTRHTTTRQRSIVTVWPWKTSARVGRTSIRQGTSVRYVQDRQG